MHLNLLTDKIPQVDLILCRDCLIHFSYADIFRALKNICDSKSEYLLTTTFTERKINRDITTGNGHLINLEIAPFNFPAPLKSIIEGCTEDFGANKDKALGLWRVADIEHILKSK
jgi:hypothetical protein